MPSTVLPPAWENATTLVTFLMMSASRNSGASTVTATVPASFQGLSLNSSIVFRRRESVSLAT